MLLLRFAVVSAVRAAPPRAARREQLVTARDVVALPGWFLRRLAFWAPPSWLLTAARLRGNIDFLLRKRRWVVIMLREVYGGTKTEAELRAIYKAHLQYRQLVRASFICSQKSGFIRQLRPEQIEGIEHLRAGLAAGSGVILLSMHFGYYWLGKRFLANIGLTSWDVTIFAEFANTRTSRLKRFVFHGLLRLPQNHPPEDHNLEASTNIRPILEALKRNEIVCLTADGRYSLGFLELPVFGRTLPVAKTPVRIAQFSGAALIPAFVVDTPGKKDHPRVMLLEPIALSKDGGRTQVEEALAKFIGRFESIARAFPHLYAWNRLRLQDDADLLRRKFLQQQVTGERSEFVES